MRLRGSQPGLGLYPTILPAPPTPVQPIPGPFVPVDLSDPIKAKGSSYTVQNSIIFQRNLALYVPPPIITAKKFTGGHYGNFNTGYTNGLVFQGSSIQAQMNAIAPYQNIKGFHVGIHFAALEPVDGPSDVSSTYPYGYATGAARLKEMRDYLAAMTPPRKIVPYALFGYVTKTNPGATDYSVFPQWFQNDPTFGPSGGAGYRTLINNVATTTRVTNRWGWWGLGAGVGGQGGNTCTIGFSRPAVLNRLIQQWQTFGRYFDGDDMFESIDFSENSFIRGANQLGLCPDFSYSAWLQAEQTFLSAIKPFWPRTGITWQNTYENNSTDVISTMQFMMANGIDWGSTDTAGYQTYCVPHSGQPYTDGAKVMCGFISSPTNWRDLGYLLNPEVEAPDYGAYGGVQGFSTPADILACHNNVLHSRKVYWAVLLPPSSSYGSNFHLEAMWSSLGPYLNDPTNALLYANQRPTGYG